MLPFGVQDMDVCVDYHFMGSLLQGLTAKQPGPSQGRTLWIALELYIHDEDNFLVDILVFMEFRFSCRVRFLAEIDMSSVHYRRLTALFVIAARTVPGSLLPVGR